MNKELFLIKKTVEILDSVDYGEYSDGRAKSYLDYIKGNRADERILIAPILLPKFIEEILNFKLGINIIPQEKENQSGQFPDFIPSDIVTHPFVIDAKGTDTIDLSKHFKQISEYMKIFDLKYGILTNIRDLDVYTPEKGEELAEYNFNLVLLYKSYKNNDKNILEEENTKTFLNFVRRFKFSELTQEQKIYRIENAKPWTGKETLNIDSLIFHLRNIVNALFDDVCSQTKILEEFPNYDIDRALSITQEIQVIISEITMSKNIEKPSIELYKELISSQEKSTEGKAFSTFLRRIAYFTMTRLVLARIWEDIGFINQSLFNGGFKKWYRNFNNEIKHVLKNAFGLAAERYKWLFNVENNYSWYEPNDNVLIDSLYELSSFNLGKLDQDILGVIYEEYVDHVDKKNKGQYYTPREIVSFIWNRIGLLNLNSFFYQKLGKRYPKLIYDPATGSGGFLAEAACRLKILSGYEDKEFEDVLEVYRAILYGFFGSEISPFPYYLTEVNLLIQLTPIIKRAIELKKGLKETTPLGVICVDSLALYTPTEELFPSVGKTEYKELSNHKILPSLDAQKKTIYDKIRNKLNGKFSYCCSNPPYVGEKGHKGLFQNTIFNFSYWKDYYQGKMDYLHWFIILGISKLHNFGKLGFITTSYWPIADGASKLRRYILENCKILEMIYFGDIKIFEYAKGQHNLIFILQKCSQKEKEPERNNNRIKIVEVKAKHQEIPGIRIREKLSFITRHIENNIDKYRHEDKFIKIFLSSQRQGDLVGEKAWTGLRVDTYTEKVFSKFEKIPLLTKFLDVRQGIVPGVDRVTKENIKYASEDTIKEKNIKVDDGIFVLTKTEVDAIIVTPEERDFFVPSYRNSHILPYIVAVPKEEQDYILYIDKEINLNKFPGIKSHLEKFKRILTARLERYEEREYKESYPWYRLNRPRDRSILSSDKIVVSNWGNEWQPFALQNGEYFEKRDITLFVRKKDAEESLLYFLAILNSKLIRYWMNNKMKQVGYMRQNLQENIPIRKINFNSLAEKKIHDQIVDNIKLIRDLMFELNAYSKFFESKNILDLNRKEDIPELKLKAVINSLKNQDLYSIRTHPKLNIEKVGNLEDSNFYLKEIQEIEKDLYENYRVQLLSRKGDIITLKGPADLLKLVIKLLEDYLGNNLDEIKKKLFIPNILKNLELQKDKILMEVSKIKEEILKLQNNIDDEIYKLYNLTENDIKVFKE